MKTTYKIVISWVYLKMWKNTCNQYPSIEECRDTVMNMKNDYNITPGLDGIPVEFSQFFGE